MRYSCPYDNANGRSNPSPSVLLLNPAHTITFLACFSEERNRRDDADKVLPNFIRPVIVRKKIHRLFCSSLFNLFPVGHHAPAVQILYLILTAPSVRNEFRREGRYYPKYIFFYFYNSLFKQTALFRAARFSFSSFAISAQSYPSMGGRFTVTIYSFE